MNPNMRRWRNLQEKITFGCPGIGSTIYLEESIAGYQAVGLYSIPIGFMFPLTTFGVPVDIFSFPDTGIILSKPGGAPTLL